MKKNSLVIMLTVISVLSLIAQPNNSPEKWKSIFEKYNCKGTFVLYNTSTNESKIFNKERSDSSYLPASTFKILNSLIALETSVVNGVGDTIKWDGVDRGWDKWNRDHTMESALKYSGLWFYQELARRIGNKRMQKWIDTVGYGNTKMGSEIDNFWLEGDLRISAFEQVKFIERLIDNDLPFKILQQEEVKRIMITDSTENYTLHSKTGLALRTSHKIGWIVGYVETKTDKWIFALNLDLTSDSSKKYRKQISYDILKEEGLIN